MDIDDILGYARNGKRKKWLDFRRDPDHHLWVLKVQKLSSLGGGLHSPSALVYLFIYWGYSFAFNTLCRS